MVKACRAVQYAHQRAVLHRNLKPSNGRAGDVDTRSDVWVLGLILYQLLTGRLPHDTSGLPLHVMKRIERWDGLFPRQANPNLNGELEASCSRLWHGSRHGGTHRRARSPTTWADTFKASR